MTSVVKLQVSPYQTGPIELVNRSGFIVSNLETHGYGWVVEWRYNDFRDWVQETFSMSAIPIGVEDGDGTHGWIDIVDLELSPKALYRIAELHLGYPDSEWEKIAGATVGHILKQRKRW